VVTKHYAKKESDKTQYKSLCRLSWIVLDRKLMVKGMHLCLLLGVRIIMQCY